MAGVKIKNCECIYDDKKLTIFWDKKWLLWYPKYGLLGNFFCSEGNQIFFVYNYNTATHGGHFFSRCLSHLP
jgi:hypothetical protein